MRLTKHTGKPCAGEGTQSTHPTSTAQSAAEAVSEGDQVVGTDRPAARGDADGRLDRWRTTAPAPV